MRGVLHTFGLAVRTCGTLSAANNNVNRGSNDEKQNEALDLL